MQVAAAAALIVAHLKDTIRQRRLGFARAEGERWGGSDTH